MLLLRTADVYQDVAPDNIALPLGSGDTLVWVRRAVYIAAADRRPAQIQVSWLPALVPGGEEKLRRFGQDLPWPKAVQNITGQVIATVRQKTRARGANPFEAKVFAIAGGAQVLVSHLTTLDPAGQPIEHSRFTWPHDAVRLTEDYSLRHANRGLADHGGRPAEPR